MIYCGVRHEHRPADLEQNARLNGLHMSPKVLDTFTPIAKPTSTCPWLDLQLQ
jgi:hypothetical protein